MLYKKKGMPEESDLVLTTITKIQFHSVFANLDEYEGKTGMIHISEISPGRIRNIFDFVREGKVVVCKVLKINYNLGHIDLSLRRVSEGQKRMKMDEIKQEQLAEKIIELFALKQKKDFKTVYYEFAPKILEKYKYVHNCFLESITDKSVLEKNGVKKEYIEDLHEMILLRNKPKELEIKENIILKTYEPSGLEIIKKVLKDTQKVSDKVSIKYNGGGTFNLVVVDTDFKEAEKIVKKANHVLEKEFEKHGEVEIKRID